MMAKPFVARRGNRIGKKVGTNLYIHKSAVDTLIAEELKLVNQKKKHLPVGFAYAIIKLDLSAKTASFLQSPDWDTASEPCVGDSITVKADNATSFRKATTKKVIYHHKWLFVKDSYQGFDVEKAKRWSEYWENHPHVMRLKADRDERFKSRIGSYEYWKANVLDKIL